MNLPEEVRAAIEAEAATSRRNFEFGLTYSHTGTPKMIKREGWCYEQGIFEGARIALSSRPSTPAPGEWVERMHDALLKEFAGNAFDWNGERVQFDGAAEACAAIAQELVAEKDARIAELEGLCGNLPTKESVKSEALKIEKEMESAGGEDLRQSSTARVMFLSGAWFARGWNKKAALSSQNTTPWKRLKQPSG